MPSRIVYILFDKIEKNYKVNLPGQKPLEIRKLLHTSVNWDQERYSSDQMSFTKQLPMLGAYRSLPGG